MIRKILPYNKAKRVIEWLMNEYDLDTDDLFRTPLPPNPNAGRLNRSDAYLQHIIMIAPSHFFNNHKQDWWPRPESNRQDIMSLNFKFSAFSNFTTRPLLEESAVVETDPANEAHCLASTPSTLADSLSIVWRKLDESNAYPLEHLWYSKPVASQPSGSFHNWYWEHTELNRSSCRLPDLQSGRDPQRLTTPIIIPISSIQRQNRLSLHKEPDWVVYLLLIITVYIIS